MNTDNTKIYMIAYALAALDNNALNKVFEFVVGEMTGDFKSELKNSKSRDGNWIVRGNGTFTAPQATGTDYLCGFPTGLRGEPIKIKYEVEVIGASLDFRGFVMDVQDIADYFDRIAMIDASAEELAKRAANYFAGCVENAESVCVRLWGSENTSVEYCWPAIG